MKHNNAFDQRISDTLHACGDAIEPSPALRTRVMAHVEARQPVRRFAFRRSFVAVAAALALAVTGAVAAGTVTGLRSGFSWDRATSDYTALAEKAESKLGEDVVFLEQIGGANFENGSMEVTEKLDDTGSVLGAYDELDAIYKTADGAHVNLYAYPHDDEVARGGAGTDETEIREIGGVDVTYKLDHYIFVPVGYEPTAEEQAAIDAGELHLSFGMDEREEEYIAGVYWEKDGICYDLLSDAGVSAEALFDMAADMIG